MVDPSGRNASGHVAISHGQPDTVTVAELDLVELVEELDDEAARCLDTEGRALAGLGPGREQLVAQAKTLVESRETPDLVGLLHTEAEVAQATLVRTSQRERPDVELVRPAKVEMIRAFLRN